MEIDANRGRESWQRKRICGKHGRNDVEVGRHGWRRWYRCGTGLTLTEEGKNVRLMSVVLLPWQS